MPTGRPLSFRCGKCLRRFPSETRITPVGATRERRTGRYEPAVVEVNYQCEECGHRGWTGHRSVVALLGKDEG